MAKIFDVTLRFQFPAWDEKDGIAYRDISANSKSDAIDTAKRKAKRDGHLDMAVGKGRKTFSAVEVN